MNSVVLISILLSFFQNAYARIELQDFYPYGPENGDTSVPTNDDGSSGLVNIGFPYPFFDEDHESLFVNTNGVISFLREVSQFTTDAFPLGDQRRLIAPFWADVDTTEGGVVYYRETQDLAIRTRVSEEIRKYFVRQRRFSAKWAMIVTWLDVAAYGGNSSTANTFQTILATDGINSFSIFYYNKIEWTFGTASSSIPAQAGFNAGDGIRYFNILNSRTPAISNVSSTSNYQVPGLWIFKVDGETVENYGCTSNGSLVLSPRSGIELGGTGVFIGGPCYKPEDQIVCRFNHNAETNALYVSAEQAYCVTPPLYVNGRIPVELSLDGGTTFNFTGIFRSIPVGRNPPDIQGLDVEKWADSSSTILTWDQNAINSSHIDIEILLFDTFEFRLHEDSLAKVEYVPNNGNYNLDLSEENIRKKRRRKRNSGTESPIAVVSITSSLARKKGGLGARTAKLFSKVYIVSWLIGKGTCEFWATTQSAGDIARLQEELPPCPTNLRATQADRNFVADSGIKRLLSVWIFHPDSKLCFRSTNASPSGAGQQCCYNENDRLMVGPPGGGTLDVASPDDDFWGHMGRDVLPWVACCKLTNNCNKYYMSRPSDDGSRYIPPPVAATRGDPHLATFDGTLYTFNGFGEYVLLKVNDAGIDLEFQGRMTPIVDDQGKKTKATALTALVIREAGSDIVQVKFNSRRAIDVFVNGDRVEFDEQTRLDFTGVFIVKENQSEIGIYLNSSVTIDTKAIEDFLTYQISIPSRYKEKTTGLLGFWNDNKDEEFLLPNGSFIHTNSNSRTLHYEFGQKWIVERNKTLFTYKAGESYDSFSDVAFTPIFLDEALTSLFANFSLKEEAKDICGDNEECLFDIAVTGKTSVGKATLESFNELQQRTNDSQIVDKPIFFGCDGIENSYKRMDTCGICGGDNSTCIDCLGNIRPGFVDNGTCGFYHPWNEWSNCFKNRSQEIKTRNRTCSVEGHCRRLIDEDVEYRKCSPNVMSKMRARPWSYIFFLVEFLFLFYFW